MMSFGTVGVAAVAAAAATAAVVVAIARIDVTNWVVERYLLMA
jgi:hypothetical protein